jgi:hypothetical protein
MDFVGQQQRTISPAAATLVTQVCLRFLVFSGRLAAAIDSLSSSRWMTDGCPFLVVSFIPVSLRITLTMLTIHGNG